MIAAVPEWLWWVLVIFLAGIIGQFGKSLTLTILKNFSAKKKEETNELEREEHSTEDPKVLKKRDKAEKKRRKKEAKVREKAE